MAVLEIGQCCVLRSSSHVSSSLVRASLFSNTIGLKLLQLVFLAEPEVPEEALAITKSDFFVV